MYMRYVQYITLTPPLQLPPGISLTVGSSVGSCGSTLIGKDAISMLQVLGDNLSCTSCVCDLCGGINYVNMVIAMTAIYCYIIITHHTSIVYLCACSYIGYFLVIYLF